MKNSIPGIFIAIFLLLAVTASVTAGNNATVFAVSKSLLMPVLMLVLLFSSVLSKDRAIVIAGLFFSWAGDVLLLFEQKDALFFIGGLVCFLTTHILYIIYFFRVRSQEKSMIKKYPWIILLVASYGICLVYFLIPFLGDMKLPVMIYAVVICSMVVCSFHVFTLVNKPAGIMFIAGALLFAASDSLLAINKFYQPFPGAGLLVISTYCAAQLLIVLAVKGRK